MLRSVMTLPLLWSKACDRGIIGSWKRAKVYVTCSKLISSLIMFSTYACHKEVTLGSLEERDLRCKATIYSSCGRAGLPTAGFSVAAALLQIFHSTTVSGSIWWWIASWPQRRSLGKETGCLTCLSKQLHVAPVSRCRSSENSKMGECVSEQGSEGITEGVTVSCMHYLHTGNNLVS